MRALDEAFMPPVVGTVWPVPSHARAPSVLDFRQAVPLREPDSAAYGVCPAPVQLDWFRWCL